MINSIEFNAAKDAYRQAEENFYHAEKTGCEEARTIAFNKVMEARRVWLPFARLI